MRVLFSKAELVMKRNREENIQEDRHLHAFRRVDKSDWKLMEAKNGFSDLELWLVEQKWLAWHKVELQRSYAAFKHWSCPENDILDSRPWQMEQKMVWIRRLKRLIGWNWLQQLPFAPWWADWNKSLCPEASHRSPDFPEWTCVACRRAKMASLNGLVGAAGPDGRPIRWRRFPGLMAENSWSKITLKQKIVGEQHMRHVVRKEDLDSSDEMGSVDSSSSSDSSSSDSD